MRNDEKKSDPIRGPLLILLTILSIPFILLFGPVFIPLLLVSIAAGAFLKIIFYVVKGFLK